MRGNRAVRIAKLLATASILIGVGYATSLIVDSHNVFVPSAFAEGQGVGKGQGGNGMGGNGQGRAGQGDAVQGGQSGVNAGAGQHGSAVGGSGRSGESDEDSDRPAWAQGNRELNPHAQGGGQPAGAGSTKGDLYGDLYEVLRDENGVPILLTLESGLQVVQPVDASGNLIPLDAEGEVIDASLLQEVEFGRLSIGRSPSKVLDHALDEALTTLTSIYTLDANNQIVIADGASITYDEAGRLVVTVDGTVKTIDSPLENLALYTDLMINGTLSTTVTLSYEDAANQTVYVTKEVTLVPNLDLDVAASLLAAAADKTGTISVDLVAYENSILGVNEVTDGQTVSYFDYSTFTYDRAAAYADATVAYLEPVTNDQGETTYVVVEKSVLDAVFGGEDGVFQSATENVVDDNIAGFTSATDDALQVIEFIHDYALPES